MTGTDGNIARARFDVSSPQVIHETIEGEVIIINLATGTYYSLKGSATEIWALVQRPTGIHGSELIQALAGHFSASPGELEVGVGQFLAQLRDEELVSWQEGSEPGNTTPVQIGGNDDDGAPVPFTQPILEKFTDMQDLVLLDPVHEVAGAGWPLKRDEAADGQAA